ncbi:MAG: hypothetical protein DRO88_13550 [Promethearchaeia archaeon]|nr:MAG: hypothetical protein DRO88_13550 [Candidatus Lokiarchaeia archaeon]
MEKIKIALLVLRVLEEIIKAKEDDGKINAGEVAEIVLTLFGSMMGLDSTNLKRWIKETESLVGDDLLSRELGFLKRE